MQLTEKHENCPSAASYTTLTEEILYFYLHVLSRENFINLHLSEQILFDYFNSYWNAWNPWKVQVKLTEFFLQKHI